MTVTVTHRRDVSASVEVHLAVHDHDGDRFVAWWARCFDCDWEDHYADEHGAVAAGEDHGCVVHRWDDDRDLEPLP